MKNSFPNNLRYYRKANNLTQRELAEIIGIDRSTLTAYETGKRECNFDKLIEISEILNVSIDSLLK